MPSSGTGAGGVSGRPPRPQMSTTHHCSTDPGTSFTKDEGYAIGGIVSRPSPFILPPLVTSLAPGLD